GIGLQAGGNTITNQAGAQITGGAGGNAGTTNTPAPTGGAGGAGIITFGNDTIVNRGSIVGGAAGMGSATAAQAGAAIRFNGTGNQLQVYAGSSMTGNLDLAAGAGATIAAQTAGVDISNAVVLGSGATLGLDGSAANLAVSGVISGAGNLAQGSAGTTVLTGANTYSGTTGIAGGGTLQVGNGGTTGTLGTGAVTNNGTLAFNRSDAMNFNQAISGSGALTKSGAGTLTLTGANTYSGGTTVSAGTLIGTTSSLQGNIINNAAVTFDQASGGTYAGNMSGTGSLTKNGVTSAVILTGTNTYAGPTNVDSGILVVGNGGTAGTLGTGALALGGNGLVIFDRSDTAVVTNDISGNGVVAYSLNGSGTTVFTGNNTTTGLVSINAGTLQVGNGGTTGNLGTGSISNNGALVLRRSDAITVANTIYGSGSLTNAGGSVTLTANNSYAGTTTINAGGTLQVGNGGTTGSLGGGNVINNGTLVFNRSAPINFGNSISGSGGLTVAAASQVELQAVNTYTGTTTVNAGGYLLVEPTGTLGAGNLVVDGSLNLQNVSNITGDISGSGTFTLLTGSSAVLTGANTHTGATNIATGATLQIGDGNGTGALGTGPVNNSGALVFNRNNTVSVANPIAFGGSLTQNGAGNLILTGANTYSGATTVNAGTLSVNGSIASSNVTVNTGAILGGTGTVGNTTITSGGVLAPGNSIGTLNVAGNLTFNTGSIYRVEADAAGNADRINASGTATINGGTVDVQAQAGTYFPFTNYTILSAAGGRTGNFASATSNFAYLTPVLS
ncbi:MAG: transporter, partial [Comamonadaceae bacterium]